MSTKLIDNSLDAKIHAAFKEDRDMRERRLDALDRQGIGRRHRRYSYTKGQQCDEHGAAPEVESEHIAPVIPLFQPAGGYQRLFPGA